LPHTFEVRVDSACTECGLDPKKQGLFAFVERVAQVYHARHKPPPRGSDLYLDRNEGNRLEVPNNGFKYS